MKEEVLAIILVPNMIYFERVLRSKATLESRKQLQTKPNTYGVQVHGALSFFLATCQDIVFVQSI